MAWGGIEGLHDEVLRKSYVIGSFFKLQDMSCLLESEII